ncbi:MAG: hypothetical protein QOD72_1426, partial [Acidimicrobiaceae bacterium]|nr:hypothetical protein [Acidimicrobiaceae bacterium]
MTVADVLDGGIAVIKAAPRAVFVIAGAFIVPLELVSAWVERDTLADRGLTGALSAATSSSGSSGIDINAGTIILIVLSGLVLSLVTGAVAHLVSSWFADNASSAGDALRASVRRAPTLIGAWFIVHLAESIAAVALVLPAVFVMPLFL